MDHTLTPPTMAEAIAAVDAFASAAGTLAALWQSAQPTHTAEGVIEAPAIDGALTETYPTAAMPMSFDEVAAEIAAWSERMREVAHRWHETIVTLRVTHTADLIVDENVLHTALRLAADERVDVACIVPLEGPTDLEDGAS